MYRRKTGVTDYSFCPSCFVIPYFFDEVFVNDGERRKCQNSMCLRKSPILNSGFCGGDGCSLLSIISIWIKTAHYFDSVMEADFLFAVA